MIFLIFTYFATLANNNKLKNNYETHRENRIEKSTKSLGIVKKTNIFNLWESAGAKINLVGSLKTGLLVKHKDIDFHIYSENVNVNDSFSVITKLAQNPKIRRIEFNNLLNTDEKCIEWHAWYEDDCQDIWKIDMIHIVKNSFL